MSKSLQTRYIELALEYGVLLFGEFTLKSGRVSPYFHDMGRIHTGPGLLELCDIYAEAIAEASFPIDVLFGPAYKGIPLATGTAMSLATRGIQMPFAYNRKEAKSHGEGGSMVGHPLKGHVCMIDDVMTAGTAYRQSKAIVEQAGAQLSSVFVALDRQECNQEGHSTLETIRQSGVQVHALISFQDLMDYIGGHPTYKMHLDRLQAYTDQYGCA